MKQQLFKFKTLYLILFVVTVFILGAGTTYAYWAATASSNKDSLQTESIKYSINMELSPLYNDFSFIPMNDTDAVKALRNGCKDKYGRGACSAYKMKVFGYSNNLSYISGYMDVTTDNMINLSYMMYKESETYDENSCVEVENKYYCIALEPNQIGEGTGLTLGDKYDVFDTESIEFILLIWLTNLNVKQNEFDIGNFNAVVTMQAGSGGQIKGTISSAVKVEDDNNINEGNNNSNTGDENINTDNNTSENGEVIE